MLKKKVFTAVRVPDHESEVWHAQITGDLLFCYFLILFSRDMGISSIVILRAPLDISIKSIGSNACTLAARLASNYQ